MPHSVRIHARCPYSTSTDLEAVLWQILYTNFLYSHPIDCGGSNIKPKALHTAAILVDEALAVFLRIACFAEKHAFISKSLFVLADAAGFGFGSCLIRGFDI